MVVLFVILTFIVFLTIDYFVQRAEIHRATVAATLPMPLLSEKQRPEPVMARRSFPIDRIPRGVFFNPNHTWMRIEPSGVLRLGIDMLPVTALGKVESILVSPNGSEVHKGDPVMTLKRGNRSLTLQAPVDGIIEEINARVQEDPSLLRRNPFGQSWIYRLSPKRLAPLLKEMLVGEEAIAWMQSELRRLSEVVGVLAGEGTLVGATLQDGGLPVEGFAEYLDDESWEWFVNEFFHQPS